MSNNEQQLLALLNHSYVYGTRGKKIQMSSTYGQFGNNRQVLDNIIDQRKIIKNNLQMGDQSNTNKEFDGDIMNVILASKKKVHASSEYGHPGDNKPMVNRKKRRNQIKNTKKK